MKRKKLIKEIKELQKQMVPPSEKYIFYAKNRYIHKKGRKGNDWIDYITVYKGIFSLWKPVIQIKWIYVNYEVKVATKEILDEFTEKEFCFSSDLNQLETKSLETLKKDLITLSI